VWRTQNGFSAARRGPVDSSGVQPNIRKYVTKWPRLRRDAGGQLRHRLMLIADMVIISSF